MLEPDEVKASRPVLRELGAGNSPRLPGGKPVILIGPIMNNLYQKTNIFFSITLLILSIAILFFVFPSNKFSWFILIYGLFSIIVSLYSLYWMFSKKNIYDHSDVNSSLPISGSPIIGFAFSIFGIKNILLFIKDSSDCESLFIGLLLIIYGLWSLSIWGIIKINLNNSREKM
ncbi:MAG: transmembrane 9 family protein [Desulfobacteraceae bacterium]|nr:transmembrane 9 family protein [Desulfobacteraceae bacterium]